MPENIIPEKKDENPKISLDLYINSIKNISVLFLYQDTVTLIKKDSTLQKIVINLINIINTYEEENSTPDQKTDDFCTAYNVITGNEASPIILTDEMVNDFEDEIAFLPTYIKNSLNKEWSEIIDSFSGDLSLLPVIAANSKNLNSNPHVETVETERVNPSNNNQKSNFNNASGFGFNNKQFVENNINMDQMAEQILTQQATMLLTKDIKENKFYQFESKPSMFIWFKWIYYAVVLLFLVGLMIWISTFLFSGTSSEYLFYFGDTPFETVTNEVFRKTYLPKLTFFGVSNYMYWISFVLIIFMAFSNVKKIIALATTKNDNIKFSHQSSNTFILVFLFIFIILNPYIGTLFGGGSIDIGSNYFDWLSKVDQFESLPQFTFEITEGGLIKGKYTVNNAGFAQSIKIIGVTTFILIAMISSVIVSTIVIKAIRPRPDVARIQEQLNKYKEDIKAGLIDASSFTTPPGFPGMGGMGGFGRGRSPFGI
ncbi:MAG: hypothetical protein ACRC42_04880 [Mycoplasma sp.]